jgi:hypothetical protein
MNELLDSIIQNVSKKCTEAANENNVNDFYVWLRVYNRLLKIREEL